MQWIVRMCSVLCVLVSTSVSAMTDAELQAVIQSRLSGDRTGACMAVAVVQEGSIAQAFACANPDNAGRIDANSAFEIGSVSKTMTAALLADWIVRGEANLDDRLADWLPAGTPLPEFDGKPIRLGHILTHTSGLPPLPPGFTPANPVDPYADLAADDVLAALGNVTLETVPGIQYLYSNFAVMVLSDAIARRAGVDFETLLKQRLLMPLGMDSAWVNIVPDQAHIAIGHASNTQPAPAWHFPTNLAGVGGVRATLQDMVGYVRGLLGWSDAPIAAALELAQRPVSEQPAMAMAWMLVPVAERVIRVHEGGTGGFSAFVAVDQERQRGVVVLSDTAWHSLGGLGAIGLHLIDPSIPMGSPRKEIHPSPELLDGLVGEWQLQDAMRVTLRQRARQLFIEPEDQEEYALGYDDAGDFFLQVADAVLRPRQSADGDVAFVWIQGGGMIPARRISAGSAVTVADILSEQELQGYVGQYPLMPGFSLSVRVHRGNLQAQASGQGAFMLETRGEDRFVAPAFGIEIIFKRDAAGQVQSLDLHQAGHVLSGQRQ